MSTQPIMFMLAAVILCVTFDLPPATSTVSSTGSGKNILSKILTGDRDKLDDKTLWIRRYRAKMLIILTIIIVAALIDHFAL